jgi:hypothetical protein
MLIIDRMRANNFQTGHRRCFPPSLGSHNMAVRRSVAAQAPRPSPTPRGRGGRHNKFNASPCRESALPSTALAT